MHPRRAKQAPFWAWLSAMRRAPQLGQKPRRLQLKGHELFISTVGAAQAQQADLWPGD